MPNVNAASFLTFDKDDLIFRCDQLVVCAMCMGIHPAELELPSDRATPWCVGSYTFETLECTAYLTLRPWLLGGCRWTALPAILTSTRDRRKSCWPAG